MARELLIVKCPKCGGECKIHYYKNIAIYDNAGVLERIIDKENFVSECLRCGFYFRADLQGEEIKWEESQTTKEK